MRGMKHRISIIGIILLFLFQAVLLVPASDTMKNVEGNDYSSAISYESPEPIREIGNWSHGQPYAVVSKNEIAYLGEGSYLQLINISNAMNPFLISELYLARKVRCIFVEGNYAYVGVGFDYDIGYVPDGGLWVVDISDPLSPQSIYFYHTATPVSAVLINGTSLFLAERGIFHVLNVANRTNPEHVATFSLGSSTSLPLQIAIQNELIAVAHGYGGLKFYDGTNLTNIQFVTNYSSDFAGGIALRGNIAFYGDGYSGFKSLNISNLSDISLINSTDPDYPCYSVFLKDDFAFTSGNRGQAFDISDPANITKIQNYLYSSFHLEDSLVSVDFYQNLLLIPNWLGLTILNIAAPTNPEVVSLLNGAGHCNSIAVRGDLAYVDQYFNGISVINVYDPNDFRKVGSYGSMFNQMEIFGNFIFGVGSSGSLSVLNITDPQNPKRLDGISTASGTAYALSIDGDYAYLACRSSGLRIVDIDHPSNLAYIGEYDLDLDWQCDVACASGIVYLLDGYSNLYVIDVTNPYNPQLIVNVTLNGQGRSVQVFDDVAYVTTNNGLYALNISTPSNPFSIGNYSSSSTLLGEVRDDFAYIATFFEISILNITDLNNIYEAAKLNTSTFVYPSYAKDIDINQGRIFAALGFPGFREYDSDTNSDSIYSIDEFQLSHHVPEIDSPPDTILNIYDQIMKLSWHPESSSPLWYEIYCDGKFFDSCTWNQSNEIISFNPSLLSLGEHVITVTVWDKEGISVSDSVTITLIDEPGTITTTTTTTTSTITSPTTSTSSSTTPTSNLSPPEGPLLLFIGLGSVIIITLVLIFLARKGIKS